MIIENVNNHILLTGAGFSHNFGTPLANEMRALIFNSPEIQRYEKLRELHIRLIANMQKNQELIGLAKVRMDIKGQNK